MALNSPLIPGHQLQYPIALCLNQLQDFEASALKKIQRQQRLASSSASAASDIAASQRDEGHKKVTSGALFTDRQNQLQRDSVFVSLSLESDRVLVTLVVCAAGDLPADVHPAAASYVAPTAASPWSVPLSSLALPTELQRFCDAQRIIVMDAIRYQGRARGTRLQGRAMGNLLEAQTVEDGRVVLSRTLSLSASSERNASHDCAALVRPLCLHPPALGLLPRRTDFRKNSLSPVGAISQWVSSRLAESATFQRLSSRGTSSTGEAIAGIALFLRGGCEAAARLYLVPLASYPPHPLIRADIVVATRMVSAKLRCFLNPLVHSQGGGFLSFFLIRTGSVDRKRLACRPNRPNHPDHRRRGRRRVGLGHRARPLDVRRRQRWRGRRCGQVHAGLLGLRAAAVLGRRPGPTPPAAVLPLRRRPEAAGPSSAHESCPSSILLRPDVRSPSPSLPVQVLRLVSLLSSYAAHDPETGYCQG